MPISNYTTTIDSMKTVGEVQKMLIEHDATKIMVESQDKIPTGITFQIGDITYRLPANWQGVLKVLERDPKVEKKYKNKEQAQRTTWRIILYWVEAQMAIIEAEAATVEEVFLPYAVLKNGNTVYQEFKSNNFKQLGQ